MAPPPFTLDLEPLDEETAALAEKELRETPEIVREARKELRELLRNDPTIEYADDDEFLDIFLRPCKFYAKSAHELMIRIANFKEKHKHLLQDLMPEDEKDPLLQSKVVNVLKDRDHKGRRVLIVNCGGIWDPSKISIDQIFRMFYIIHELAVLEPKTQVRGAVVLLDFHGLGMKQVLAVNPIVSMRLLTFVQDAMPVRIKEVHIVRQPLIFNLVWKIFKPFVREKLRSRLYFHGNNMESFHKFLAPSHLPKDYDGDLPEIDYSGADWYPTVEKHLDHINKMNACGLVK